LFVNIDKKTFSAKIGIHLMLNLTLTIKNMNCQVFRCYGRQQDVKTVKTAAVAEVSP